MAIEKTDSYCFLFTFVDSINVYACRLSEVLLKELTLVRCNDINLDTSRKTVITHKLEYM